MAWRFKASKYKNAAPIIPKPENYVRDICVGSYQTYGNNICASAKFMAFNWDHAGSSLAVLPIDDSGRKTKLMPLLHAHTDTVTDMNFSPFHDGLLATGSQDCLVKIWYIPKDGLQESLSNPECTFSHKQRRVETVGFHPTADYLLHSTSFTTLTLWDLISEQELFCNAEHTEVIQSVSWKRDGSLLSTSCKDKQIRIFDPRIEDVCIKTANSHQSIKDSRVVWLGDNNKILTTGFDAQRLRQIIIRDLRNFQEAEKSLELDCSTGILIPLYDADTKMLFLAGKGDTTIGYMEVTEKEPYLIEGIRYSGEQTKGACLIPKRALNVMQGEVNRILQLTSSSVIPITYQVPRKTYRDFHGDLYPDTPGYKTELTAEHWFQGKNIPLGKISLDPSKRDNGDEPIITMRGTLSKLREEYENNKKIDNNVMKPNLKQSFTPKITAAFPKPDHQTNDILKDIRNDNKPRLGPKPFTPPKLNESETFDKVFCVPAVPGQQKSNGHYDNNKNNQTTEQLIINNDKDDNDNDNNQINKSDTENGKTENDNSGGDDDDNDDDNNCDSGYKPKTPSTAERRKLFEINSTIKENDNLIIIEDNFDNNTDQIGNFERSSFQRNSIAERRKMYENRSQSVQDIPVLEKSGGSPVLLHRKDSFKNRKNDESLLKDDNKKNSNKEIKKIENSSLVPKRTSTVFGRVSKFRHLKGTTAHKSFHIENVRNISRQIAGECDGFQANSERVAVPLSGPGGKIAIFELNKTGRLPDGVIPALVNSNNIMDFMWDPFDYHRLAVACDDGIIKIWQIPENGLKEPTNEPFNEFCAHNDKIYFIKFHPTAKDVLASGSYDMTVKIWDLSSQTEKIVLNGHSDQIFSFSWSPCGIFCSTVSKDGKIRIYKPRTSNMPIREGKGPVGSRGARIVWALDGNFIVVTGFDKVSERQIMVFKSTDLCNSLNTIGLDVSPAILIPFYDEDSSTLLVTGKGDSTIYAFEITEENPFICALSHHRCNNLHQGLSFLPKNICDVSTVEFAKALRLTNNSIEPLSFTVPRIKTELFQDDLFPPTKITWKPTLSSIEWFNGKDKMPPRISLKPDGMDLLSKSMVQPNLPERTINKSASSPFIGSSQQPFNRLGANSDFYGQQAKLKQDEIQKSVSNKVEINLKLEQDDMEGVDEKEWDD